MEEEGRDQPVNVSMKDFGCVSPIMGDYGLAVGTDRELRMDGKYQDCCKKTAVRFVEAVGKRGWGRDRLTVFFQKQINEDHGPFMILLPDEKVKSFLFMLKAKVYGLGGQNKGEGMGIFL